MKQGKQNELSSSRWTKFATHVLIACTALLVVSAFLTPTIWYDRMQKVLGVINSEDSSSSKHIMTELVTADEYRNLARRNGWSPIDPLRKLEETIKRLPQVFDMEKDAVGKSADSLIQMIQEEIVFLTKVFRPQFLPTFVWFKSIQMHRSSQIQRASRLT